MTPREQTIVRDLRARLQLARAMVLEIEAELADARLELAAEKRTRRKAISRGRRERETLRELLQFEKNMRAGAERKRREALDSSRFLHGVLILNGIEIPEPLSGRAA